MGIIRFLLAISVVIGHIISSLPRFVGGPVAVQSFYIISGFYMSLILNEKYIKNNNSYILFVTNRLLRLYPIYWIILLITISLQIIFLLFSNGIHLTFSNYLSLKSNFLTSAYLILSNILIFNQDVFMFLGIDPANGNLFFTHAFGLIKEPLQPLYFYLFIPQAWSLGIELTFYLLAPFILKKGFKLIGLLIILSLLLRFYIYDYLHFQDDPWTYRFFPTEIILFLFGYVSYKIYLFIKSNLIYNKYIRYVNWIALLFTIIFTFLYSYLPSLKISYLPFSVKEMIYFSTIVLCIPLLFNFLKNNKFDSQIGELSYLIYISHILVAMVCTTSPFMLLKKGWAIVLITIIFSYFLNKFIALPIEKYRQSRLLN